MVIWDVGQLIPGENGAYSFGKTKMGLHFDRTLDIILLLF